MGISHAHLFKQDTFSDARVVFKLAADSSSAAAEGDQVLKSLPAHRALLSASPVLRAQLERWSENSMSHKRARSDPEQQQQSVQQQQQQQIDIQQQEAHSQDEPDLPVAAVLLESEDQVEAAEAVIAALYGVSTATDNLTGCHLVHMVVLADMLQVEAAAEAAACRLTQVAHELSAEARQQLCAMQAWPACLMKELPSLLENFPLQDAAALWAKAAAPSTPASLEDLAAQHSDYMQNRLVQELGNLEEVWSDADQPQLLLGLPLPAMQLLLASDDLQVSTEDTVLFTAQRYVNSQEDQQQRQAAEQQLAQLVRCPHLSHFWLTAALQAEQSRLLLVPLREQPLKLLAYLQVCSAFSAQHFNMLVPNTPPSWLQGARLPATVDVPVTLRWELPISQIRGLCLQAFASKTSAEVWSPSHSPPLKGVAGQLVLRASYEQGGVKVGMSVGIGPKGIGPPVFMPFKCRVSVEGLNEPFFQEANAIMSGKSCGGWQNYFGVGVMAGGWDDTRWAAKGFPTQGNLVLEALVWD